MICELSICLSKLLEIFLELLKWAHIWKVFQQVVVNVADQDVADVKNNKNHQANEKVCVWLKNGGT